MPSFDKNNRRRAFFEHLPKDAYVVKIMNAKEDTWPSGKKRLKMAFDIAEGDYTGFYKKQWEAMKETKPGAEWPFDGVYNLNIPGDDDSKAKNNWDYFFCDLMDSNGGFEYGGDPKTLRGKVIGGKFRIKQTEYNGRIYDHTEMLYSCTAESVRSGEAAKNLPNDKLIAGDAQKQPQISADDFINVMDSHDEELPFD